MCRLIAGLSTPLCTQAASALTIVYGITTLLSLILLIGCFVLHKKKDPWMVLLFFSVLIVNSGYLWLSISQNLSQALNANRLAYLGSVFLPLAMWMIILRVTRLSYKKWLPQLLIGLGVVIFLIAASPGILDIYYQDVSFTRVDGISQLHKVYGPLHPLYLVYLLGYFAAIVTAIVRATLKKTIQSTAYATVLAIAVFVNIAVWLAEQFIDNGFEFLSVSYIISELFLMGLQLFMEETEKKKSPEAPAPEPVPSPAQISEDRIALFTEGLSRLTPKEKDIFDCYVAGLSTAQITEKLSIKENTLKFHNKNLYSKLGVSSRKQLLQIHNAK